MKLRISALMTISLGLALIITFFTKFVNIISSSTGIVGDNNMRYAAGYPLNWILTYTYPPGGYVLPLRLIIDIIFWFVVVAIVLFVEEHYRKRVVISLNQIKHYMSITKVKSSLPKLILFTVLIFGIAIAITSILGSYTRVLGSAPGGSTYGVGFPIAYSTQTCGGYAGCYGWTPFASINFVEDVIFWTVIIAAVLFAAGRFTSHKLGKTYASLLFSLLPIIFLLIAFGFFSWTLFVVATLIAAAISIILGIISLKDVQTRKKRYSKMAIFALLIDVVWIIFIIYIISI